MVGWIILGVIVGIIVLIMLIPIGADIRYENEVIRISVKAAGLKLQLLPRPKKKPKKDKPEKEKPEKEKTPKEKKPKEEKETKKKKSFPFNAEEIMELLRAVLQSFGRFGKKFSVDRFVLHWIAPQWDPYTSARIFAWVNAAMSELAPICTARFHCRDSSVWTDIDFTRENMFLEFGLTITIRIGQIVGSGFRVAFDVLRIFLQSRRRVKREEKEEAAAIKKWLEEHPEDAALLNEQKEQAAS
jgi:hypothetical protein